MLPMILALSISKEAEKLIEQIYEKYYGTMKFVANNILKDHALADDAVADAFIKISRHLDKLHDISCHKTKGYIVSAVRTISYDIYNKRERRKEDIEDTLEFVPDKNINILADLVNQDSYDSLKEIIQSLPEPLRDVAYLFASGYSHEEIAQVLGISYDNSKKRLSRARKMAQKLWVGGKNEKQRKR